MVADIASIWHVCHLPTSSLILASSWDSSPSLTAALSLCNTAPALRFGWVIQDSKWNHALDIWKSILWPHRGYFGFLLISSPKHRSPPRWLRSLESHVTSVTILPARPRHGNIILWQGHYWFLYEWPNDTLEGLRPCSTMRITRALK